MLVTYGMVFVAKLVGDKLLYVTGVLATSYRSRSIVPGVVLAFMAKMGFAVLAGNVISQLPPVLVAGVTSVGFLGVAITLWRKPARRLQDRACTFPEVVIVSFGAVFLSEWCDAGQITAATMAAQFNSPLAVWIGATGAMVTKTILAACLGNGIRRWIAERIPEEKMRYLTVSFALLSVLETLIQGHA